MVQTKLISSLILSNNSTFRGRKLCMSSASPSLLSCVEIYSQLENILTTNYKLGTFIAFAR